MPNSSSSSSSELPNSNDKVRMDALPPPPPPPPPAAPSSQYHHHHVDQAPLTPTPHHTNFNTPSRNGTTCAGTPKATSSSKNLTTGRSSHTPNHNYAAPHTPIASAKRPRSQNKSNNTNNGAMLSPSLRGSHLPPHAGAHTPGRNASSNAHNAAIDASQFSPMHPPTSNRLQAQHRIAEDGASEASGISLAPANNSKIGGFFSPLLNLWKTTEEEGLDTNSSTANAVDGGKDSVMMSPSTALKPRRPGQHGTLSPYMDLDDDGDLKILSNNAVAFDGVQQQSLLYDNAMSPSNSSSADATGKATSSSAPPTLSMLEMPSDGDLEKPGKMNGNDPGNDANTSECSLEVPSAVSTQMTEEESPCNGVATSQVATQPSLVVKSLTAPEPKKPPPHSAPSSTTTTTTSTAVVPETTASNSIQQAPSAETAESEESEEDEFNPYLFIKHLPPYHSIRSPWSDRRQLSHYERMNIQPKWGIPPKARHAPPITLVLDLDETLVHCTVDTIDDADLVFPVVFGGMEYKVHVRLRPYLEHFLRSVAQQFEVVVFTASQKVYANELLNRIDPKGEYIQHRMYRESCLPVEGNYLKDLNVLGTSRRMSHMVLVDNSPHAFGYQVDNGIPIESWYDDPNDRELLKLDEFLRTLHGAPDVRPLVRARFQSYRLIANA